MISDILTHLEPISLLAATVALAWFTCKLVKVTKDLGVISQTSDAHKDRCLYMEKHSEVVATRDSVHRVLRDQHNNRKDELRGCSSAQTDFYLLLRESYYQFRNEYGKFNRARQKLEEIHNYLSEYLQKTHLDEEKNRLEKLVKTLGSVELDPKIDEANSVYKELERLCLPAKDQKLSDTHIQELLRKLCAISIEPLDIDR